MNEKELKMLIEKYYNGTSTEDDEKALRAWFSENGALPGNEAEMEIFSYFMEAGEVPEPSAGFEAGIIRAVDKSDKKGRHTGSGKILLALFSAAAGLLILAGSYFFFIHRAEPKDTFTDPRIAYAETMKILMDISAQINHGTRPLEPVGRINEVQVKSLESINKSAVLIEKNLKSLGYLRNSVDTNNASKK